MKAGCFRMHAVATATEPGRATRGRFYAQIGTEKKFWVERTVLRTTTAWLAIICRSVHKSGKPQF